MNLQEIRTALANMDSSPETGLSTEKLFAIKSNIPTPEELAMIEAYEGDKDELGNAEQYFMAVSKIPQLELRVNSLDYKSSYQSKSKDILATLKILLSTIKIVDGDPRFHRLFEIVLAVGNYLNGSTKLGQTHGFKLQSLAKIGDVKNTKNSSLTLNHYLAEYLGNEKLIDNFKEFTSIHEAARVSTTELGKNVIELVKGLEPINAHLEGPNCDESYIRVMKDWAEEALKINTDITQKNQLVVEGYKKVTALFAEPPSTKSEEFFAQLSSFITSIEQANMANNKRKAEEAALQKKNEMKKKSSSLKSHFRLSSHFHQSERSGTRWYYQRSRCFRQLNYELQNWCFLEKFLENFSQFCSEVPCSMNKIE